MPDKLIKAILNSKCAISLWEANNGYYITYIVSDIPPYKPAIYSEVIKDLNIAMYLFDIKLTELEGN